MRSVSKTIAAIAACAAIVATSTPAAAAAPATPAPQVAVPNAWLMLASLDGTSGAAAQPTNVPPPAPPPGPPPPAAGATPIFTGEVLAIILWFGLIAIALTSHGQSVRPNSPG